MCRRLAEENGDSPKCDKCGQEREPQGASRQNLEALEVWQRLDLFGREIDAFAGLPRPLKLEAVELECKRLPDPDGAKWRVIAVEEKVWGRRVREWEGKRKKG